MICPIYEKSSTVWGCCWGGRRFQCRIKDDSYAHREVREVKTSAKSLSLLHISKKSCIFAAEIGVL